MAPVRTGWPTPKRCKFRTLVKSAGWRLQEPLVSINRREFPKVQAQIVQQLSSCRKRLEGLGADRESTDQQRRFLLEMSRDSRSMILDVWLGRLRRCRLINIQQPYCGF